MSIGLVLAAMLSAAPAGAPDPLTASLNAPIARKSIYLAFHGTQDPPRFEYVLDQAKALDSIPVEPHLTIAADGTLNLRLDYLNPLEYSWRVSEETAEDPTYASAGKFLESLGTLLAVVTPAAAAPAGAAKVSALAAPPPPGGPALAPAAPPPSIDVPELYSPEILPWAMWIASDEVRRCIGANTSSLQALVTAVGAADAPLYGQKPQEENGPPVDSAVGFAKQATKAVGGLRKANGVPDLAKATDEADAAVTAMKEMDGKATTAVTRAADLAAKFTVVADTQCAKEFADNFARYSKVAVGGFVAAAKGVLARRGRVVANLGTLISGVRGLLQTAERNDDRGYFKLGAVAVPRGRTNDVTIHVRRRELPAGALEADKLAFDEKPEASATIRILNHQSFLLDFAVGAVYTNLTYPRFGTAEEGGATVVAGGGEDELTYSIVGMLGIVPNIGFKGLLYPVLQIGVGTGRDYPLLLAGGGIRLLPPYDLSLTFGAAWTWVRVPKTLEIGDRVEGTAQLEDDMHYEFQTDPAFYIGVQRAF